MFMRHPASSDPTTGPFAQVTDEAFDSLWSEKGWVKVDDAVGQRSLNVQAGIVGTDVHPETEPTVARTAARAEDAPAYSQAEVDAFDPIGVALEDTPKPFLIAVAKARGVSTGGSKEAILARLQARQDVPGASQPEPGVTA